MEKKRERKAYQKGEEVVQKVAAELPTDKIVCGRTEVPSTCGTCGSKLMIGGPIWHDPIHNIDFVRKMHEKCSNDDAQKFGTIKRIKGILGGIIDEHELSDVALSFDFGQICSNLKV